MSEPVFWATLGGVILLILIGGTFFLVEYIRHWR